jgi:uncharacterized protein (UPF0335 family)
MGEADAVYPMPGRVTMPFGDQSDGECTVEFDPSTKIGQALQQQLGEDLIARTANPDQTDIEHDVTGVNPSNAAKVGGIAGDRLRSIVERIERLEEERKVIAGDIRDIKIEAKSAGFDVSVIGQLLKLRKKDPAEAEEQESLLDPYKRAIGM